MTVKTLYTLDSGEEVKVVFDYIPEEEIPPTSVLREFLGGSSFNY